MARNTETALLFQYASLHQCSLPYVLWIEYEISENTSCIGILPNWKLNYHLDNRIESNRDEYQEDRNTRIILAAARNMLNNVLIVENFFHIWTGSLVFAEVISFAQNHTEKYSHMVEIHLIC